MNQHAESEALKQVAELMALAARTAPKGRGQDNLAIAVLDRADIQNLAKEMVRLGQEKELPGFLRDAENISQAQAALLLGTRLKRLGLKYCGLCGFGTCAGCEKAGGRCAFNSGDLGIAVGSAVATAAAHHADNRIMYSMGLAALSLRLLGDGVEIALGIPLSGTGKSPFFDRQH
jgi:uncharacterized ferredoxin-like protein